MTRLLALLIPLLAGCGSSEESKGDKPAAEAKKPPKKAEPKKPAPPTELAQAEAPPLPENLQKLLDPSAFAETAPGSFKVKFETTAGDFVVQVNRDWAPNGADRFYNLVQAGWFTDVAVFRGIDGFMAQFGLHGEPQLNAVWRKAKIDDDPAVGQSNTRGRMTFATAGPNTRTTQLFINFKDNGMLDRQGFTPFGEVVEGMETVDALYKGYGEGAPRGRGPSQGLIQKSGNAYLEAKFPELSYVKAATVL